MSEPLDTVLKQPLPSLTPVDWYAIRMHDIMHAIRQRCAESYFADSAKSYFKGKLHATHYALIGMVIWNHVEDYKACSDLNTAFENETNFLMGRYYERHFK